MSEVSTAAGRIDQRLRSAPTFHPSSADLFADWNIQAGDVVTVRSDEDSYQVPIYDMHLKWTGAPKVEIESTGNPEREPLPAIKRREYSANSSNYSEQKSLRGGVGAAQQAAREINGVLYDAGLWVDPVTGIWAYASETGENYALGSTFAITSRQIQSEVTARQQGEQSLSSQITQTANQIALKVSKGDVSTQLAVECGNVTISGGNLVVDGYITSAGLATAIANISGGITAHSVSTTSLYIGGRFISEQAAYVGGVPKFSYLTSASATAYINYDDLPHYHTVVFNDGTITIGGVTDTAPGPFDITATTWYTNKIAAARASGRNSISATLSGTPTRPTQGTYGGEATGGWYYQAGTSYSGSESYDRKYGGYVYVPSYTQVNYAKSGLTSAGYRTLYYYSDTDDRYVPASGSYAARYWYYTNSSGWETLYKKG